MVNSINSVNSVSNLIIVLFLLKTVNIFNLNNEQFSPEITNILQQKKVEIMNYHTKKTVILDNIESEQPELVKVTGNDCY